MNDIQLWIDSHALVGVIGGGIISYIATHVYPRVFHRHVVFTLICDLVCFVSFALFGYGLAALYSVEKAHDIIATVCLGGFGAVVFLNMALRPRPR